MKFDECIRKKLVIKKSIDLEIVKSLKSLVDIRLTNINGVKEPTLRVEAYYEIIKELLTALLIGHGYKSYSHECLVSFLEEHCSTNFTKADVHLIDQLRIIRNDIAYRGAFVEKDYLLRNEKRIGIIIDKLKQLIGDGNEKRK